MEGLKAVKATLALARALRQNGEPAKRLTEDLNDEVRLAVLDAMQKQSERRDDQRQLPRSSSELMGLGPQAGTEGV